ncbi:MAG: DUF4040 domain-containing protein [Clostridiales bacterium]|nr:DUF4040 domain-containing protein [Clostridiales bacterium]
MMIARYILYFILIVTAFLTVQGKRLRNSVIYLGIFSLVSSLVYLLLYAPDVAIAEAIIGCTISVILFLTALKKYKTFVIYYVPEDDDAHSREFLLSFEKYLAKNEFGPQLIHTSLDDSHLHDTERFDVLIVHQADQMILYSSASSYHSPLIRTFLENKQYDEEKVSYFSLSSEDVEYED